METHENLGMRIPEATKGPLAWLALMCGNAGPWGKENDLLQTNNDLVRAVGLVFKEGLMWNTQPYFLVDISDDFQNPAALVKFLTCQALVISASLVFKAKTVSSNALLPFF